MSPDQGNLYRSRRLGSAALKPPFFWSSLLYLLNIQPFYHIYKNHQPLLPYLLKSSTIFTIFTKIINHFYVPYLLKSSTFFSNIPQLYFHPSFFLPFCDRYKSSASFYCTESFVMSLKVYEWAEEYL